MKLLRLLAVSLVVGLSACNSPDDKAPAATEPAGPLRVAVSNYPMKYFAERIGGSDIQVMYLAPADGDPAFWTPTPDDVRRMQQADLILLNGAGYEKWVGTVTLPESKVVETAAGFRDKWLTLDHATTHSHGPAGDHSHSGTDFNTWLDPRQAILQADAIRTALDSRRPESAQKFAENFGALKSDLTALDAQLEAALARHGKAPLVASHPVYGYFARRYGLNLKAVLWEPESMPSDAEWGELKQLLASHPARTMLWEGEPDPQIEARLNELGVTGIPVPPAGNTPGEGDYLTIWTANAKRLAETK